MSVIATAIGLAGAVWSDWATETPRNIWLAAAACVLIALVITAVYFVQSNTAFAAKAIPIDQVPAKLDTWQMIHNLRIALAVAASALGVWAISR